jgi:hypothetical protein
VAAVVFTRVVADGQTAGEAVDVGVLGPRIIDRAVVIGVAEVGGRALEEESVDNDRRGSVGLVCANETNVAAFRQVGAVDVSVASG